MPIAADPDAPPDGRLLLTRDGRLLARFTRDEREGRRWADLLTVEPGVAIADVAGAALRDLPGHRVSGPPALAHALLAAGGTLARHAHVLRHRLERVPPAPPPPGIRLTAIDRPAGDLVASSMVAYAPGHWDFAPGDDDPATVRARLAALIDARPEHVGALLPSLSRLAVDDHGAVQGGAIVVDTPRPPPYGGAWLAELWRAHAPPGTGTALLGAVLAAAAAEGREHLGLAVTEGNPARRVYERAGFEPVLEAMNVDLDV